MNARVTRTTPMTLVSKASRKCSSFMSKIDSSPSSGNTAALFTSTSRTAEAGFAFATAAFTD